MLLDSESEALIRRATEFAQAGDTAAVGAAQGASSPDEAVALSQMCAPSGYP